MWSYSSDDIGDVIADPDGGRFIVVSRSENCGIKRRIYYSILLRIFFLIIRLFGFV